LVSTLCGNGLNPFYVACRKAGIQVVDTRNEQAASYMADAYARLTRRVGVCAVSSGIGHTNALSGVVNAYFDGAPMLLLSGASAQSGNDLGTFQELDHVALAAPVCKYARFVDRAERMAFYVHEALAMATSGRPGPVHLTVPIDVLEAEVDPADVIRTHAGSDEVRQQASGDPDLVREAAELIANAERPVLIAGSGVFYAQAENALERFATATAIPVVVPIWDRGAVPRPAEHFLGVVGAASGGPRLLPDADLVLMVGARVDYRIGYGHPPTIVKEARVVCVDVDAEELRRGLEPDVGILGDARSVLDQLAEEMRRREARPHRAWLDEARRRDRAFHSPWIETPAPAAPPMAARHIVDALRPFVRDDALFLVDGGNIGQWAHMALCDRYPGHWLTCGASGVVGWGLPGAMAAKCAYPDRPVILLSGDGSIGFTLTEFESAVRQGIPFVVVLADDRAWGIVLSGQEERYGPDGVLSSRLGEIRYDRVAEGLGAIGVRVERPEEIAPAIERGLRADRPTLIHVPIRALGPNTMSNEQ
jgi:acetolactate synthase-1/2/3 large subunit